MLPLACPAVDGDGKKANGGSIFRVSFCSAFPQGRGRFLGSVFRPIPTPTTKSLFVALLIFFRPRNFGLAASHLHRPRGGASAQPSQPAPSCTWLTTCMADLVGPPAIRFANAV